MAEQHAFEGAVDFERIGKAAGAGLQCQLAERIDQADQQFVHHHMLGAQPVGDRLEAGALRGDSRKDRFVLDRMVHVDDIAVLAAEVPEAPVVGHHGEAGGLVGGGFGADLAGRGPFDQHGKRLHVGAQVIVHLPEVQPGGALRLGQAFELDGRGPGGVVEKSDIEQHPRQMGR